MAAWRLSASLALPMRRWPGCSAWYLHVSGTCITGSHECWQRFCHRCRSTALPGMNMLVLGGKWGPTVACTHPLVSRVWSCGKLCCLGCSAWHFEAGTPPLLLLLLPPCTVRCVLSATMLPYLCYSLLMDHGWTCHVLSVVRITKCELSCLQMDPKFLRNQVCL